MIPAFFSFARMILLECHESPAAAKGPVMYDKICVWGGRAYQAGPVLGQGGVVLEIACDGQCCEGPNICSSAFRFQYQESAGIFSATSHDFSSKGADGSSPTATTCEEIGNIHQLVSIFWRQACASLKGAIPHTSQGPWPCNYEGPHLSSKCHILCWYLI